MATADLMLKDRFAGCLLGLAIGDALGAKFEAQSPDAIRARFSSVERLIAYPQDEIWYTDDTQMAIGVAETLVLNGEVIEEHLCRAFVANYVPSRGYGRGARAVLEAMEAGRDHRQVADRYFAGGSFGNGAAMRVAPVGLLFRDDRAAVGAGAAIFAGAPCASPRGRGRAAPRAGGCALFSRGPILRN
jgi:poly(ADP-ribose) glycohydrolase ARH3